ncbi:hypothetical protein [Lysobacter soli]|uniref:hypothetical protein n=1 Tax=Lysobacter soli TaxID=453783 RepID=UPI0024106EFE|nr:hypothetical protein [Lysobacter soli]MDG2518088.1 hypothetical protein [Lysobacter soli]
MDRSPLWRARAQALTHLSRDRPEYAKIVEDLFALVDECIDAYERGARNSQYARVCGLTTLKAKNLGLGAYSLILDGLGQEAGALLRPFIEYTELLTYFKRYPDKVGEAENGSLPPAGARAKAIGGIYRELREHLNAHASHSSYSKYSLSHLFERGSSRFKKLQHADPTVLERNVRDFAIQLYLLVHEATLGLEPLSMTDLRSIGGKADTVHERLTAIFELGQARSDDPV